MWLREIIYEYIEKLVERSNHINENASGSLQ